MTKEINKIGYISPSVELSESTVANQLCSGSNAEPGVHLQNYSTGESF